MLFNSLEFLIFLPIVFLVHWLAFRSCNSRNLFLIVASYLFYGWWNPVFLVLIFLTTICSFISAIKIEQYRGTAVSKIWLWVNIALNLGILGVFKYYNFFTQSFADTMTRIGWSVDIVTLDLILPVGISFYTFQALSYGIDVYKHQIAATRNVGAFIIFISFFPQLVAGPIERATNLLPQFLNNRRFDYEEAVSGMRLILWGLFKKMVVADNAAPRVDTIFGEYEHMGTLNLWIGAILFSIQIYCDFSGYSDIAVGTARLFGIRLMHNFRLPYFSRSITEFWKKWHISLTSWFRDYVYIPLGGNRKGKLKTIRNTVVVFLASGLWHGANYTFIVWGGYHALLYLPHIMIGRKSHDFGKKTFWPAYFRSSVVMGITFLLVVIGWVFFRSNHLSDALRYIELMFTFRPDMHIIGKLPLVWSAFMFIIEWFTRPADTPFDMSSKGLWSIAWFRQTVYVLFFLIILFGSGMSSDFIYFQF